VTGNGMNSNLQSDEKNISLSLPWNPFTARGFAVACVAVALLIVLFSFLDVTPVRYSRNDSALPDSTIMLIFGPGDGTGARKGNLTAEGVKRRGKAAADALDDATSAMKSAVTAKTQPTADPMTTSRPVPTKNMIAEHKGTDSASSSTKSIGDLTSGTDDGTGLGVAGAGRGKGEGWGDIDWGGGGNRVVLVKKKPPFPVGAQPATIRIQFRVRSNGTVGRMMPLQKADPRLEQAAMDALRLWKFNPIPGNAEMVGIIPFQFKLN